MNRVGSTPTDRNRPIPTEECSPGSASSPVSCPNQAFLLAVAAWSESPRDQPDSRLNPELRGELSPLLEALRAPGSPLIDPSEALTRLRRAHRAQSRPDLDRIHPSWFLRALREEPPSVRAAVARHGPPRVRQALRASCDPRPDEPATGDAIPPEVLGWVLALWTERLVGDLPERDDDPIAIAALTRLTPRSVYRIARMTGLVKVALAEVPAADLHQKTPRARDRERIDAFRRFFTPIEPAVRECARRDTQAADDRREGRHTPTQHLALIGLSTFGRLLASCEPYRVRWALQHLPYSVAKRIRNQMPRKPLPAKSLVKLENLILAAAWRRLDEEGKILPTRPIGSTEADGRAAP